MEERAWRCYVADSLQMMPKRGYFTQKYSDRFKPPEPEMDGDKIASDTIKKLGLKIA